jgi:hypothetical protein
VASPISEELERFIRERLPSVEQVEIVLLLRGDHSRAWSAPEVANSLGTPPEPTAMRLFLLASNGLLAFEVAGLPRYRYAADAAMDAKIAELAEIYLNRPAALEGILDGAARDPLRSFADAFKLKK